jgi:hypothetical protein
MQATTFRRRAVASAAVALALSTLAAVVAVPPLPAGAVTAPTAAATAAATSAVSTVEATTAATHPGEPAADPGQTPTLSTSAAGLVTAADPATGQVLAVKVPARPTASVAVGAAQALTTDAAAYTVVTPETGGVQIAQDITGPSAPTAYAYRLTLPLGYAPYLQPNGTIALELKTIGKVKGTPTQAGTLGIIEPAWATDAQGNAVPTTYTVDGATVTQHVTFNGDTAFPVVADPQVSFGWVTYVHFFHSEVGSVVWIAAIAGAMATLGWACGLISVGWLVPICIAAAAALTAYLLGLFQTAWNRGGGIVLEFNYYGWPWAGYMYVGDNWR